MQQQGTLLTSGPKPRENQEATRRAQVGATTGRSVNPPDRLLARYGPWAVVTGASDGIGRAMARELAASGLNLILCARRRDILDPLGAELSAEFGVEALVVDADLADPAGVAKLLAATEAFEVGLLVAAAGFGTSGPFLDNPLDEELGMLDVNCRAVTSLAHHFGTRFSAQRRGGLVLLSSLLAFQGVARAAHYAATKAYVQSLAEGLRAELRPFGVDVVASAPGPIRSGFAARAGMTMASAGTPESVARETLRALGRSGTVRPGFLSKLLELSLSFLPRRGRVFVLSRVMAGMTERTS